MQRMMVAIVVLALLCGLVFAGCGERNRETTVLPGGLVVDAKTGEPVEADREQPSRSIVGAWQGERTGFTLRFLFRPNGTGFVSTTSWAGGDTTSFSYKIAGDRIEFNPDGLGLSGRYEWSDKNLIIHHETLIEGWSNEKGAKVTTKQVDSVIYSRVPETIGG